MKFSEMVYTRPDYPAVLKELEALTQKLSGAKSSQEQVAIYKECETLLSHLETPDHPVLYPPFCGHPGQLL